ncbi:MAG: hypothetical protein A2622_06375 [Bdellovibrionales bacterium RIFCSPHIGHO2_01_FULL_40_29]|nr:MAG: hypothetical protein A2622_06375 [Bdellovibrionales bacterium RIFCSPHIGHO2_01_FULL_40_29]OFZ35070.1 MAG: hypothetical protein A3D17_06725 [Bdellovibrionales bacterium RIFCSPHIGHO2_02_FULL_40_15]
MKSNAQDILYRIAQPSDVESIYEFEVKQKVSEISDEYERMMSVWTTSYRKESLEHYLKLGWSFLATDTSGNIQGFFLGQPLLFFDHYTQTLWVEYMSAINEAIATELMDVAYRLSREKYFQRVLVSEEIMQRPYTKSFPFQTWERKTHFLKTTK